MRLCFFRFDEDSLPEVSVMRPLASFESKVLTFPGAVPLIDCDVAKSCSFGACSIFFRPGIAGVGLSEALATSMRKFIFHIVKLLKERHGVESYFSAYVLLLETFRLRK